MIPNAIHLYFEAARTEFTDNCSASSSGQEGRNRKARDGKKSNRQLQRDGALAALRHIQLQLAEVQQKFKQRQANAFNEYRTKLRGLHQQRAEALASAQLPEFWSNAFRKLPSASKIIKR